MNVHSPTPRASSAIGFPRVLDISQQQTITEKIDSVERQVQIIRSMIQTPDLCTEILNKLAEAETSLNKVSLTVLKMHVETCVPGGIDEGEEEGRNRLAELVDIFDRFAK
jgi:DNA-binding FrmR family transcriptional regulator